MPMRHRMLVAVIAILSLVVAACGTRLDHDIVVRAAAGTGAGAGAGQEGGLAGEDGLAVGEDGTPLAEGADAQGQAGGDGAGDGGTRSGSGPASRQAGGGARGDAGRGGSGGDGPGGPGSGGPPITIGNIGTYSGGAVDPNRPGARALQAWAAAINAKGGLNGREVKVIVMDDRSTPSRSRSLMQELVEKHKVVAVVAAMTPVDSINAWRSYVTEKGVPIIGTSCGTGWSGSPMFFRQCPSIEAQLFGTARLGAQHGKGKAFGGLFCSESASCSAAEKQLFDDGDAKRAGLDPRYRARISVFQTDFTAECIQARNNGVQLLFVAGPPSTVERIASSCQRQNYSPQFLQVSATMAPESVTKPGLGDALVSMPVFPWTGLATPAFKEFEATWKRYGGGGAPTATASMGWASAKLLEKAAGIAGNDISRQGLIKALRTLKGERLGGLTAPMTFTAKGPVETNCVFFLRGSGGKWVAPNGGKPTCW